MNTLLLVGGISLVLAAVTFWYAKLRRPNTPLLSDEHLNQVATELNQIFTGDYESNNPPIFRTAQGLLVSYMRQQNQQVFLHNISLTVKNQDSQDWNEETQRYLTQFISNSLQTTPYAVHISEKKVLAMTYLFDSDEKNNHFLQQQVAVSDNPWKVANTYMDFTINRVNTDEIVKKNDNTPAENTNSTQQIS